MNSEELKKFKYHGMFLSVDIDILVENHKSNFFLLNPMPENSAWDRAAKRSAFQWFLIQLTTGGILKNNKHAIKKERIFPNTIQGIEGKRVESKYFEIWYDGQIKELIERQEGFERGG